MSNYYIYLSVYRSRRPHVRATASARQRKITGLCNYKNCGINLWSSKIVKIRSILVKTPRGVMWTLCISNSQGTKEFVRDRERKLGWNQSKGTEKIIRDRKKFEMEGVRYRESTVFTIMSHD